MNYAHTYNVRHWYWWFICVPPADMTGCTVIFNFICFVYIHSRLICIIYIFMFCTGLAEGVLPKTCCGWAGPRVFCFWPPVSMYVCVGGGCICTLPAGYRIVWNNTHWTLVGIFRYWKFNWLILYIDHPWTMYIYVCVCMCVHIVNISCSIFTCKFLEYTVNMTFYFLHRWNLI